MALTAEQIVSAINSAVATCYPDTPDDEQELSFTNNLMMMFLQGKRIIAEAEATIVRMEAQTAAQQAEAQAQQAGQAAQAANVAFLEFVAGLANQ